MTKLFALFVLLLVAPLSAQAPIAIRTTEIGDSTRFTITWAAVPLARHYNVSVFSNPRRFDTEMVRNVLSGTPTWTITALRSNLVDELKLYVNIVTFTNNGSFLPVNYAAITYRLPRPAAPTNIIIKKDSL